jgi:hypothetical protein
MSSTPAKQPETQPNMSATNRILANLKRIMPQDQTDGTSEQGGAVTASPSPAPVVQAQAPVVREVVREVVEAPIEAEKPVARTRPAMRIAPESVDANSATTINRKFAVGAVKGTKTLTVRMPHDLHARLLVLATANKIANAGEPDNMNDLVIRAVEKLIRQAEAA